MTTARTGGGGAVRVKAQKEVIIKYIHELKLLDVIFGDQEEGSQDNKKYDEKNSYMVMMEEGLRGLREQHPRLAEVFPKNIAASRQNLALEEDVVGVLHTIRVTFWTH